jgi:hypothetical protein
LSDKEEKARRKESGGDRFAARDLDTVSTDYSMIVSLTVLQHCTSLHYLCLYLNRASGI